MNDLYSGALPPMVTGGKEIVRLLTRVGSVKLGLPNPMRGVLNTTGLHVQIRPLPLYDRGLKKTEWILKAGGSFRSYFEARSVDDGDYALQTGDDEFNSMMVSLFTPDDWNVYSLNHEVWGRRFAHLVWPLYEITAQLNELQLTDRLNDRTQISRIAASVEHFKRTGEWLGMIDIRCAACDAGLPIWEYDLEVDCPCCGAPPGNKNPEISVESDATFQSASAESPKLPTKVRAVRLESTEGCQVCPINFPLPMDSGPFDFLNDEAAHTSDFDHSLLWEGDVEVPDVFDVANIRKNCAAFIKGLLAVKSSTTPGVVYRFGIQQPVKTDEQMRLLGITKPLDRMMYRYITGGPSGIAKEIGRFIQRHKCNISDEDVRLVREGLSGFDLRIFNIALTTSKI